MRTVSDSSPLITFSRVESLDLLKKLYPTLCISTEVYHEVVTKGSGLPGSDQVAKAQWIEVMKIVDAPAMESDMQKTGLGAGEISAVHLARQISAKLILMDEIKGRKFARASGFEVIGSLGILEVLYQRGEISDLRGSYLRLLSQKIRIDLPTLQASLEKFGLPPL